MTVEIHFVHMVRFGREKIQPDSEATARTGTSFNVLTSLSYRLKNVKALMSLFLGKPQTCIAHRAEMGWFVF